jgi:acyl carrier protein
MNEKNNISDQIRGFIIERFPLADKNNFGNKTDLLESGIIDSLGILDMVEFVEKKFGILLTDDELVPENFQTVEHLAEFLARKRSTPQLS